MTDRHTLNLIAAVLCGIGSAAPFVDGMRSGGFRISSVRASVLSGPFGTIGSLAWILSVRRTRRTMRRDGAPARERPAAACAAEERCSMAFQDRRESRGELYLA